jgi:hypothetical protein
MLEARFNVMSQEFVVDQAEAQTQILRLPPQ